MQCKVCSKEIPRGQKYKSPTYKSIPFCSEECYNQYLEQKKQEKVKARLDKFKPEKDTDRRKLTDVIQSIYGEDANWPLLMRQLKLILEEYDLTDNDFRLAIKYGINYESYYPNTEYGLYQFVPFINPSMEFAEAIKKNKEQEIKEDEVFIVKKKSNKRTWRER